MLHEQDHASVPGVSPSARAPVLANTGIEGLDLVLNGGLPAERTYLIQGPHGSGKTTLSLQFCLTGVKQGGRALYLTTCESEDELRAVVSSHGWSLDGVAVHYHDPRKSFSAGASQSVFRPAEVELPEMMETILEAIAEVEPDRLVIDSLSEIRLLSPEGRWFRRQVLALKEELARRRCTTLLCDDRLSADQPVHSIVHGVIDLEQITPAYGGDRRRLKITKLRGATYASGYHDFRIKPGGIELYPRLVAAEHRQRFDSAILSSGVPELDALLGGGVDVGTAALLMGESGTGKSSLATQFAVASAARGERAAMYVFDERIQTLLHRARGLGLDLEAEGVRGNVEVRQVDPAELTPGEFSDEVRRGITERDVRMVIIDSLAGYQYAMPDERLLALHLHELLSFLNQRGVTVLMIMTRHGLGQDRRSSIDVSYIADSVLLFQTFEFGGELHRAISAYKRRGGPHENALRELRLDASGIHIGEPLRKFRGILTGTPLFIGDDLPDVEGQD